jgi:hypothetical protein
LVPFQAGISIGSPDSRKIGLRYWRLARPASGPLPLTNTSEIAEREGSEDEVMVFILYSLFLQLYLSYPGQGKWAREKKKIVITRLKCSK